MALTMPFFTRKSRLSAAFRLVVQHYANLDFPDPPGNRILRNRRERFHEPDPHIHKRLNNTLNRIHIVYFSKSFHQTAMHSASTV